MTEMLEEGLRGEGHEVTVAGEEDKVRRSAVETPPDLLILGLPREGIEGTGLLAEMRTTHPSTAVMVLTGGSGMAERLQCLEAGADDLMMKPFDMRELLARCRALFRRMQGQEIVMRFGDLEMDRANRRVTQAGREVDLTATEFALLESLLRRRGERVCSRGDLLREVWRVSGVAPEAKGTTNIVEVYINYLRKKLQMSPWRPEAGRSTIRTIRGEGYLLAEGGA